MHECPNCEKQFRGIRCSICGWAAPGSIPQEQGSGSRMFCPYDGAKLNILGICEKTGGYPLGIACPFACPMCRKSLEWDGRCDTCKGSYTTGKRDSWTFPGDRYELYGDDGKPIRDGLHWIKVDGPRKAVSPEENQAGFRKVEKILAKSIIAAQKDTASKKRWAV